jgi:UDP-N-acetylmuramate dehydrogenase
MSVSPRQGVGLAGLTTLGVGGPARWFLSAVTADDVRDACTWCQDHGVALHLLGGGSNVVVADAGIDALVLQVAVTGWAATTTGPDEIVVEVGAGEWWDHTVARLVSGGWSGVECLSGIPGTVGGTPIQNVGAYGQEAADVIDAVHIFDREAGVPATLAGHECGFGYRQSRFKGLDAGRFVVCGVRFRLRRDAPTISYPDVRRWLEQHGHAAPAVADVRAAVLAIRRTKGMVIDEADPDTRSVGSFFMNPVVTPDVGERLASMAGTPPPARAVGGGGLRIPAAWLIERAGFSRGYGAGAVGLSGKHPLAIVNRGGARASDVVSFAASVKRRVAERLGVPLRPEPVFLGFGPDPDLEYLSRTDC